MNFKDNYQRINKLSNLFDQYLKDNEIEHKKQRKFIDSHNRVYNWKGVSLR